MAMMINENKFIYPGYLVKKIKGLLGNKKSGIYSITVQYYNDSYIFYDSDTTNKEFNNKDFELFESNLNKWISFEEANKYLDNYQYFNMLNFTHVRIKIKK